MSDETAALVMPEHPADVAPVQQPSTGLTSAQARIEAVSHTLGAAMERASTLALTPEEVAKLKADFPDEAFKPGAAGKENLIYIEHAYLRDRFDEVLGMGQWAIVRTRPHWAEESGNSVRIYAECALLVRGCLVSESIGCMAYYKNNASQDYGDAAEGAVTAAFRRCAKNFGVGLQAWKKDFCDGWWERKKGNGTRPAQPATKRTYNVQPAQAASSSQVQQITGWIKATAKKATAKGGFRYGILVVADMNDEQGTWLNTFDDVDAKTAEDSKGQQATLSYTQGQYGKDLVKRAIAPATSDPAEEGSDA